MSIKRKQKRKERILPTEEVPSNLEGERVSCKSNREREWERARERKGGMEREIKKSRVVYTSKKRHSNVVLCYSPAR